MLYNCSTNQYDDFKPECVQLCYPIGTSDLSCRTIRLLPPDRSSYSSKRLTGARCAASYTRLNSF